MYKTREMRGFLRDLYGCTVYVRCLIFSSVTNIELYSQVLREMDIFILKSQKDLAETAKRWSTWLFYLNPKRDGNLEIISSRFILILWYSYAICCVISEVDHDIS